METVAVQIPLRKRKRSRPGRATMHIRLTPICPSILAVIPLVDRGKEDEQGRVLV